MLVNSPYHIQDMTGSFGQIGEFLSRIEDTKERRRLVEVQDLAIRASRGGYVVKAEGANGHDVTVKLVFYAWR